MKLRLYAIIAVLFMGFSMEGQNTTFKVFGKCGMCKERIESVAKDVIGVNDATWDRKSKILDVTYQDGLFDIKELHHSLAAVGHDTDRVKASKKAYKELHTCCKYKRVKLKKVPHDHDGDGFPDHGDDHHHHDEAVPHDHDGDGVPDHDDSFHDVKAAENEVAGMIYEKTAEGKLQPVIGANVVWAGSANGTATDVDGHFALDKVDGNTQLVISYIGYASDTIDMKDQSIVAITLQNNHILDEISITHKKRATEISFIDPIKTQNIGQKELCKAACCSLSESFETSPAVDVSFTDAVTGTRKIEMLGLAGPYVQIMRENMPYIRGLSAVAGLSYTPGPWIESMQLNLGTGSVVNGPESMTGQINVEIKKPESSEKLYVNLFANRAGRLEANVNTYADVSDKWSTAIIAHGSMMNNSIDDNNDNFYDTPLRDQVFLMNRWRYAGDNGLRVQFGAKYSDVSSEAGQIATSQDSWKALSENSKIEAWTKVGKVWEGDPFKSIGWQTSFVNHNMESSYGLRTYDATQNSIYSNFIYMNAVNGDPKKQFKVGASIQYDKIDENILLNLFENEKRFDREEFLPGVFAEYTYLPNEKWSIVAGIRGDYHNNFGSFVTPRLHVRYAPQDKLAFRIAAGKGHRTASVFAENLGIFATNRVIRLQSSNTNTPYGLNQEVAWNVGANVTREFSLAGMNTVLGLDYYYTWFDEQVVVNWENARTVSFSNLEGQSGAHSLQAQIDVEIVEGLDLRSAYRYNDVTSDFQVNELGLTRYQKPLTSKHRAFVNLAWEMGKGWIWDGTYNWQGEKRLPYTEEVAQPASPQYSPSFSMFNTQLTKQIKGLDIYLGVENAFDFRQEDAIISADNPIDASFDGAQIWGPVFGRNIYVGLRWKM